MDGNLDVAYDIDVNFVTAWNQMFVSNDFINSASGAVDPRHLLGTSNFDVFRWPSLENGTQKSALGTFITTLVVPGIPLVRPPFIVGRSLANCLQCSISTARSKTSISTILARLIIYTGEGTTLPFLVLSDLLH